MTSTPWSFPVPETAQDLPARDVKGSAMARQLNRALRRLVLGGSGFVADQLLGGAGQVVQLLGG